MRVTVDWSLCESTGFCAETAPTVFRLDDDDDLHVLVDEVPTDQLDQVHLAVRRCPRQALAIQP